MLKVNSWTHFYLEIFKFIWSDELFIDLHTDKETNNLN